MEKKLENKSKLTYVELPSSYYSEQVVLCCLIVNIKFLKKSLNIGLKNFDFYFLKHKTIFDAIFKMYMLNIPVNIVTLTDYLIKSRKINQIGGIEYIIRILECFSVLYDIKSSVYIIINKSILRSLIKKAMLIIHMAMFSKNNIVQILNYAQNSIINLHQRNSNVRIFPIGNFLKVAIENIIKLQKSNGKLNGIPSGFIKLDNLMNGFQNGELTIIAARPSMGKTALAFNISTFISLRLNIEVAFFSLEMSILSLVQRILSSETQIDLLKIKSGSLSYGELCSIVKVSKKIGFAPLYIDEVMDIDIHNFKKRCHFIVRQHNIKIIIIDYLQLLKMNTQSSKLNSITEISKELKLLGRKLNIPVLVVSQLNRNVEARTDKRPIMSDLRESGTIEQDADAILFLYREEYYLKKNVDSTYKGLTEILLAKNRNGPVGSFFLKFFTNITKFINLSGI